VIGHSCNIDINMKTIGDQNIMLLDLGED